MNPRFDGYYLSPLLKREEWHAGVHMVEEYYSYLKLFEEGSWLEKKHPTQYLDFLGYLAGIIEQDFEYGWTGRHPLDRERDLVHRTGRFTHTADGLLLASRTYLFELDEVREYHWVLRMDDPEQLTTDSGQVFRFQPFSLS